MLINENLQVICDQVNNTMPNFNDQFIVDICNELVTLGVVPDEDDIWLICFSIQKVEAYIKNMTNQDKIMDGLLPVAVDMVCGNFIQSKYLSGKLDMDSIDLDGAVKTVSQGDTSVTFETGETDESKVLKLIRLLIDGKESDLVCYRKMRW